MKKYLSLILAGALLITVASCNKKGNGSTPTEDSISQLYGEGMGVMMTQQVEQQSQMSGMPIDKKAYMQGFERVLLGDTTMAARSMVAGQTDAAGLVQRLEMMEKQGIHINRELMMAKIKKQFLSNKKIDEMAMQDKMQKLGERLEALMMKAQREISTKLAKAGKDFLAKTAKDKSFKKTPSGMYYKIRQQGNGKTFKPGDNVMVKYTGRHADGTVFDQSAEPVMFSIQEGALIKGFIEALLMMSPGEKMQVVLPANLGYGAEGDRNPMTGEQTIKANEVLVFDIETVRLASASDVKKNSPQPAAPQPEQP